MRLLLAVKSCVRDLQNGCHETIRRTWGQNARSADLRFFIGRGEATKADEVSVDAPDDYDSLPWKTREILRWSLNIGYEFTFLCDTDTFIIPKDLMNSGFEKYDVSGKFCTGHPVGSPSFDYKDERGEYRGVYSWPSGGRGYFVSAKAARVIVDTEPRVWAEDMYVGQVLGPLIQSGEIKAAELKNFVGHISWHYPRSHFEIDFLAGWMRAMQALHGASK
jgi:hypothetical protein